MTQTERIEQLEFVLSNILFHLDGAKERSFMIEGWMKKAHKILDD